MFGAVEGEGDILVVVRGPRSEAVVRRKSQVFGIWLNTKSVTFDNVPSPTTPWHRPVRLTSLTRKTLWRCTRSAWTICG